jgi:hypothetical protein
MKAQGFDPAPLSLLKAHYNPDQLRWQAGSGRDSGEWSGGASVDTTGVKDFIGRLLLEAVRQAARALLRPPEPKPANPEFVIQRPCLYARPVQDLPRSFRAVLRLVLRRALLRRAAATQVPQLLPAIPAKSEYSIEKRNDNSQKYNVVKQYNNSM